MRRIKNVKLYTYQYAPETTKGISLLIIHGLGEHIGRYKNLIDNLTKHGISVYAFDLPGHGRSPGKRGHIASFDEVIDYINRYLDQMEGNRFILGHSLGGLLALRSAQELGDKIIGCIASSPSILIPETAPILQKIALILDKIWPTLTLNNHIDVRALSRSKDIVKAYIDDPLVHDRISARLYGEFVRHIGILWNKAPLSTTSILIQVGTEDKIVPPTKAHALKEMWNGPVTVKKYGGAYHELYDDPYIGMEAINDVIDFIDKNIKDR